MEKYNQSVSQQFTPATIGSRAQSPRPASKSACLQAATFNAEGMAARAESKKRSSTTSILA